MENLILADSDRPKPIMRRGVLMSMLQQNAQTLPLWVSKPGERWVKVIFNDILGRSYNTLLQLLPGSEIIWKSFLLLILAVL